MTNEIDKATRAIIEEANRWLVEIQESGGNLCESDAFRDWLRTSPVHVREYLRAEQNLNALECIDLEHEISIEADAANQAGNVVPIDMTTTMRPISIARKNDTVRRHRWAIAAALAAVAVTSMIFYQVERTPQYETAVGEQRRVVLNDGSVVELNTDTEIKVKFSEAERDVVLVRGEALFSVAKNAERPFRVWSQEAVVSALGTQFNVYQRANAVLVTVLEGKVSVVKSNPDTKRSGKVGAIQLSVGDQAEVARGAPIIKSQTNEREAVAWRDLRLIFRDQPLSEVVTEFNRYNNLKLSVPDQYLATQRINGVFDANKPEALLKFLATESDIDVQYAHDGSVVIRLADRDN